MGRGINGMLIAIDFAKAFDTMEWSFVYKSMEHFGFPDKFINWVKILYNNIESCVINNGHISSFFSPTRGVRQGCPMSPYLFILGAEIMAMYIRASKIIKPITISQASTSVTQYADDTTIMCHKNRESVVELFDILDNFSKISGLMVNKAKTQVMNIGPNYYDNVGIDDLCELAKTVYILGIHLGRTKEIIINMNYTPILEHIRHLLNMWSQRNLSIFGKIEVIKTLAVSKLVYVLSLLPSPCKEYLIDIERTLLQFVWKNKPAKIRKSVLKTQNDMGGAGMVDICIKDMSLKLGWLTKLITFEGCWKDYIVKDIKDVGLEYFLNCNIKFEDNPCKINKDSMWNDVFRYWSKYHYKSVESIHRYSEVSQMNIWYNSAIRIANKTVFYKEWFNKGIQILTDLLNDKTGKFYTWAEFKARYDISGNCLIYMGLISAIPKSWRQLLKEYYEENYEHPVVDEAPIHNLTKLLLTHKKPSGPIYKMYVNDANDQPWDRFEKWSSDIDMSAFDTEIDWYKHIKNWYGCTKSVMLRSFIYNFNMRNMVTQKFLYTIGIKEQSLCPHCKTCDQNIIHLFWECPKSRDLWIEIDKWLSQELTLYVTTSREAAVMNIFNYMDVTYLNLFNFVFTIVKKVIYNNRENVSNLRLQMVINALKKYEKIERLIAIKNKQLQNHFNKWLQLYTNWLSKEDS